MAYPLLDRTVKFARYDPAQLIVAVRQALSTFKNKEDWKQLMLNGMSQNFSWEQPAREYVSVYEKARLVRVPK